MPGMRDHKVWIITYTEGREEREALSHDESRGTGRWQQHTEVVHIVAPDDEDLVRAWFALHFRHSGGRNRTILEIARVRLTAFIQEHIY